MNTLGCPLNLVGWQGSQVNAHAKALVGTVNTASMNLATVQGEPIEFAGDGLPCHSHFKISNCI